MGHRIMMEEESDGMWNGPYHYCEFWTAEAGQGKKSCDQKAKEPYDCCSGRGGRYIVQENNLIMEWKEEPFASLPMYTSCKNAETQGEKRCDLPGYERWYYSTGNLYRKTRRARFGLTLETFKEVYREAILIEVLRPSYLKLMNMTFEHGNHSLILNPLGVPSYDPELQRRQSDINYYYYQFFTVLARRNERPVEAVLSDFADCYLSPCSDDCHRGTNTDLRQCTDIIPELRSSDQEADTPEDAPLTTLSPDDADAQTAPKPDLLGIKQVMRYCWARGGGMCSDECLAIKNETWTCLENHGSCRRFMDYFTGQMREEEQTCLADLRTIPTTAAPVLSQIETQIWKTPLFRQVLLNEGPISAAYLVERMCSTLSTEAECERESICSWQMIRRASANLHSCAINDYQVFVDAKALDEVLSVGEDLKRACYFHGFDDVCTRDCPGSRHGYAQIPQIAGLLLFLLSS
jgi:hypothetical protein